ncbi:MAG: MTH1187 family thiamine-binding protein [Calditrichaceae bacterium]|jgi:uncharacterized protein (TIGR00106 family)
MVLADFSMSPLDKGESLSAYVSKIINIIDKSGINYKLTAMGTILEGDYDEVMTVIRDCFNVMEKDCNRISISLKIDYRKGNASRIDTKINKIEEILKRQINK